MSSVTIYCPKCTAGLKLPNRSLLGRKGKCPKCEHRFILEEPDEVQLELAEPEAAPVSSKPTQPMVGTSAKWVPDEPSSDSLFCLSSHVDDGDATAYEGVPSSFDAAARSLPARARRRDEDVRPRPMLESASPRSVVDDVFDSIDFPVLHKKIIIAGMHMSA